MLNDWGLGCISAHWSAEELFQKADESIAYAKEFGMTQMAIAALGPFHAKRRADNRRRETLRRALQCLR